MPRTIDSIMNSHHAANERREAGRPIWDRRLKIKHLLSRDSSDEQARKTAKEISVALRTSAWCAADRRTAEEKGTEGEVRSLVERLSKARTRRRLNALLDELYDLADADRVWVE